MRTCMSSCSCEAAPVPNNLICCHAGRTCQAPPRAQGKEAALWQPFGIDSIIHLLRTLQEKMAKKKEKFMKLIEELKASKDNEIEVRAGQQ